MSNLDVVAMALSNGYTDETVAGGGAIKGKNCTIESVTAIEGGHRLTFKWELDNGTVQRTTMDVLDGSKGSKGDKGDTGDDGVGIASFRVDGANLICVMTDGTESDPIPIPTVSGKDGKDGKDGLGVPSGGTTGQVLKKKSNSDNDTEWADESGGGSGTTDYRDLENKPSIENITLSGNKSASDLGLAKTSDLSDFITKAVDDLINYYTKTQTYTKAEVDTIVANIKNSRFEVVSSLPTSDIKTNVIYLVPSSSAITSNIKDEYINLDGTSSGWEIIGSTDVDLSNYVTVTDLNNALSNYVTSANLTTILSGYATTSQLNSVKENQRQTVTYIPPSASMHGEIWQYMGADMTGEPFLKSGFFYRCDYEGQGVYKWTNVNVQPSGGSTVKVTQVQTTGTKIAEINVDGNKTDIYAPTSGGGSGHAIENASGTELTQRDTLQFGEGFKVTDDSTNEKTVVDLDKLATGELDDIFDDLPPAVEPTYHKYSTVEHKVGTWIDNRPIYEKVVTGTVVVGNWFSFGVSEEIDNVYIQGIIKDANNTSIILPYANGNYTLSVLANANGHNGQFEFLGNTIYSTGHTYILNIRYTKTNDTV